MIFDQFLDWHKKIIEKKVGGKEVAEEIKEFQVMCNIKIDSYCEISDDLGRDSERWNLKAKRLTQLRDGLQWTK